MAAPSPVVNPAARAYKARLPAPYQREYLVFHRLIKAAVCIGLTLAPAAPSRAAEKASHEPDLGWSFEVALGGSLSTGNTDRQAMDLDSKAQFRNEKREDRWRLLGNLSRENGSVTANRVEGSAQTNVNLVDDKLYLLGFAEGRRDQFSGYRYETSAGPGSVTALSIPTA